MSRNINITDALYNRLEKQVSGFGDSPSSVIERLLDHFENTKEKEPGKPSEKGTKDTTKYIFKDALYGKSRLVQAVVRDYVTNKNPGITFEELKKEIFPDKLQGSIGVVNHLGRVEYRYKHKTDKRHFVKEKDQIAADETIVVCTQWGKGNIQQFIERARSLGYEIDEFDKNVNL